MKPIKDYEDYSGDEEGNVYSCKFGRVRKLKVALTSSGYFDVSLSKNCCVKNCQIHRLVYATFVGDIEKGKEIIHIDKDRYNNKLSNLRAVTKSENAFSRRKGKGYCWNRKAKKWQAQIKDAGTCIHLGLFDREEDALVAYLEAKAKMHPTRQYILSSTIRTGTDPGIHSDQVPDGLQLLRLDESPSTL